MKTNKNILFKIKESLKSKSPDIQTIEELVAEIKEKIAQDKTTGRELGPYIKKLQKKFIIKKPAKIQQTKKVNKSDLEYLLKSKYAPISAVRKKIKELQNLNLSENQSIIKRLIEKELFLSKLYKERKINFIPISNGSLAIGPRPTFEKVEELSKLGVTTIVTLLKDSEKGVEDLGHKIEALKMYWIWFPLSAKNFNFNRKYKIKSTNDIYANLIDRLSKNEKIFIHCAAGVHRTGAFSNGLLRTTGVSVDKAKELIYEMRPVSAIEAVSKHWNWSEKIIK
ncbi:MAG: tyrosine-protein phosphatase [Bacteroidota bacterium]|nr:tyrosine-protein phosphatase [Bacteroidota bacterium]